MISGFQDTDDQLYRNRTSLSLGAIIGIAFLALVVRLYYLQIHMGSYHEQLSDKNSMRLKIIKAPRGLITDSRGEVLVRNRPSYQIALLPTELTEPDSVFQKLMAIKDKAGERVFDSAHVQWSMERGKWKRFQPLVILEDADLSLVSLIEEHQLDLPGVVTVVESRRSYPHGTVASHVLGYMDEISAEELEGLSEKAHAPLDSLDYMRGDRIGRKGLEKVYESYFRGRDGYRYVRVNALGKELEALKEMPQEAPLPGHDLVTTLDLDLQQVAEAAIADSLKGAVVAIDPRDGSVLVMVSSPRIDPNIFSLSKERRKVEWARLALDSNMPLNNRAVVGGYEPGSTYKGIVSLASFRSGKVGVHDHMPKSCNGGYAFGTRVWKCWKHSGHGSLDFFQAFKNSCNVYYYQVGLKIGIDTINSISREFGLSLETNIDLDAERSGLLMDSATYNKKFARLGWRWTPGIILNLSIGQGQIFTPLQLANFAAGLGNGKVIYEPHLIREIRNVDGSIVKRHEPKVLSQLKLSEEEHRVLLKAMDMVVNEPGGTGGRARVDGIVVGGKTGSSENPHGELTHGLFIGVAPLHNPEIAIAVVMENTGHGGSVAAPVAGAVLRRYFERKKNEHGQDKS